MTIPITYLVKPASSDCNLFCDYCFYRKTAAAYPESAVHRMSLDMLETLVKRVQEGGARTVNYIWQGGEPLLMGLDFFKAAIELQERNRVSDQNIMNSIQTNGFLVDRVWARFFHENYFLVGVSLDGPRTLHNLHRFTRSRESVFDRVLNAIDILAAEDADFSVLCVVNNDSVGYADEMYNFFIENDITSLQFIPCIEAGAGEIPPFAVKPEDYFKFLYTLFNCWFFEGYPKINIRFFSNIIQFFLGYPVECCMFRSSCPEYLVIEHNGDVYPCDFFVENNWLLGNIVRNTIEEITGDHLFKEFSNFRSIPRIECEECRWLSFCNRGCIRFRWLGEHNYAGRDYLCKAHRMFLDTTEDRFRLLAWDVDRRSRGLPAPKHVRRNDPCFCGSGKKYKKCCEPYSLIWKKNEMGIPV